MIITQTPLRISFFGGGTDFPAHYLQHGGRVLSTTIDKYIFVTVSPRFDDSLRLGYSRTELVQNVDEIKHDLMREALRTVGLSAGLEINTMADIPSTGSGLGSSSSVTVGALLALYAHKGELVTADRLAREACQIEIWRLAKPIGVQDQYIAALGGLRMLEFSTNGSVTSERVSLSPETRRALDDNLLLFYTGYSRKSESILAEQGANVAKNRGALSELEHMAGLGAYYLEHGEVEPFGKSLGWAWRVKKGLAGAISTPAIDEMYETAIRAGAWGGKVTGAGGGGFLLLYVPYERHPHVRAALTPLRELPFRIEDDGAKVIFNYKR